MKLSLLPLLPLLALLPACSSQSEPLIDHINVSDAKYRSDLDACRDQTKGTWWNPLSGGSLGDCMRGRGYKVLMGGGGL